MTGRTYQKPLRIEMNFEEALERFGTTDPNELPDNIKLSRKRRPSSANTKAGGSRTPAKAPAGKRD
jgi:hypothetical protein